MEQDSSVTCMNKRFQANPLKSTVMAGAATARDNHCDFIVALGGGSVMDAAKIMAMMAPNEGDLWDYVSGGTGKGKPLPNAPLPLVCITTTAGTGSEVDQWGVAELKMTDFGFIFDELDKIAVNARETMGGLFLVDPCDLDHDGCVNILKNPIAERC